MIILKIIVTIYLIIPILSLLTIFIEKIYIKKINKYKTKDYIDIYVLLPCLKEQKIVKSTIDYFRKLKYKGNIKYIIITSEKEDNEYRINNIKDKTTNEVVKDYLKQIKDNRFIHYHYPEINGNKSSQMNYAIGRIMIKDIDLNNTYISVFDFDSSPNKDVFENLNTIAHYKNFPDAIQQVPYSIKNFSETTHKSILMTIYSMQHMVRSLAIEKFRLLISSLTNIRLSQYLMGACTHIKLSTLIDNKCFPIFVDDLTLGYRLSIKKARIVYHTSTNYSLIPNDIKGYLGSYTLIFKGVITYIDEIKRIKGYFFRKIRMFIVGSINVLDFAIIPLIYCFYYIYSLVTLNFNLLLIYSLLVPILFSLSSYIVIKTNKVKNDNKLISFLAIIISPLWFIFRPLGSIVYLMKKIKSLIFKKEINYSKTQR